MTCQPAAKLLLLIVALLGQDTVCNNHLNSLAYIFV